jgi:small subunit ribosomal protein S8
LNLKEQGIRTNNGNHRLGRKNEEAAKIRDAISQSVSDLRTPPRILSGFRPVSHLPSQDGASGSDSRVEEIVMVTDPIADLLTQIRNANMKQKDRVDVPFSKLKMEVVRVLKDEGFIANYKSLHHEDRRASIRIFLKYSPTKENVLRGLLKVSKPGLRIYRSYRDIPRVRGGFGVTILSTPAGILTDQQAREKKVGGEILCQVW